MRGVSASTRTLLILARDILSEDHPQTARQLHYRIFSLGVDGYKNDKASYRGLCRILTNARRLWRQYELLENMTPTERDYEAAEFTGLPAAFVVKVRQAARLSSKLHMQVSHLPEGPPELGIPSNWITDELRQGERVNLFENAEKYIEAVRHSYRRDNWQDQPFYVELWGEKATVLGSLRPVANEWGLTLRVCRGFGSAGMEDQVGRLFEEIEKPITVLYLGDHDASGVCIERDMHRRVEAASGADFEMVRLAIHAEDITRFDLPPQQIKDTDSRATSFRKQYGENAPTVELEALSIKELKRRVVQAVGDLIDFTKWDRQLMIQDVERASIQAFADTMKNLPQLGGGPA